jgi:mono/diheme cytochrome c family protein
VGAPWALACALVLTTAGVAHDVITTKVTWSREISRLVYKHCASCHHDGGAAFALTTYEAARPWAKAIKEEVNERRMPPWGAVKGFGEFRDDQGLSQEQIELLNDWIEGGAPEGDPKLLPPPPDFNAKPAPEKPGAQTIVDGKLTLKAPLRVEGIRPNSVPEGTSLQVVAERPGGGIEPLLWLYNYKPEFGHAYFYRKALTLPAGTTIQVYPAGAGTVALVEQWAPSGHRPVRRDAKRAAR